MQRADRGRIMAALIAVMFGVVASRLLRQNLAGNPLSRALTKVVLVLTVLVGPALILLHLISSLAALQAFL